MNTQTEALKLALDFLMTRRMGAESVIDALQEALAQPEQELTEKEKISRGMTAEFVAMRALEQQEPVEFKCVVIDNHHSNGIAFEQWVKPEQQCVACEGKPSQENNPCAVCGKTAQQEPVAWMHPDGRIWTFGRGLDKSTFTVPLYTSPPAQRKPLTDEEMFSMAEIAWRHGWASCRDAEYVGEGAEDGRWGEIGAEVAQNIAANDIKEKKK